MKVMLTGASGYIGGVLYHRLHQAGATVGLICRPESNLVTKPGDTRFDFDGGPDVLDRAIESFQPDAVIHLASAVLVEHTIDQVSQLIAANITFPTLLLEAMKKHGVKRLISAGTSWQHFTAQDAYSPANLYAATKQAFSDICVYYADAHGFDIRELRLFDVYGPDDSRRKLMPLLVRLAKKEIDALDMSPGDQSLDLVHVNDTADAFIITARQAIAQAHKGFTVYAVRGGSPITLKQLAQHIETITGQPLPIRFGGRPYRDREVMQTWQSGLTPPGWLPKYSLESGLKDVFGIAS